MARYRRVLAGGLAQQLAQGVEPIQGDWGLPGAVTASFSKLVKDASGFRQGPLVTLRDEQDIHGSCLCGCRHLAHSSGREFDGVDHEVQRFSACQRFNTRLAKFLFAVTLGGREEG